MTKSLSLANSRFDSLEILTQLGEELVDLDGEQGLRYSHMALHLAQKEGSLRLIAKTRLMLSEYQTLESDYLQAIAFCRETIESMSDFPMDPLVGRGYFQMGKSYQLFGQQDSALYFFNRSLSINRTIGDSLMMSLLCSYIGESYNKIGELQKALDHGDKGLAGVRRLGSKKLQAIAINLHGQTHVSLGQFPEATEHFLEALAIADSLDNKRLRMEQLNDLGVIFAVEGDNERSLKYFSQTRTVAQEIKSHRDYIGATSNMAYIYSLLDEYDKALAGYSEVIDYNSQHGNYCMSLYMNEGVARLYERMQESDSALRYFKLVLKDAGTCQMKEYEITALQGIGRYFVAKGDVKRAIAYFSSSLEMARENDLKPMGHIAAKELYSAFKSIKDYEMSLMYHELVKELEDSIYSKQNSEEILKLIAQYEFETEKQKLEAEKAKQKIAFDEDVKRQTMEKNYMAGGMALTIALVITLWWLYANKRKANAQLHQLNKEKNVLIGVVAHDLRNPLSVIASMLPILHEGLYDKMNKEQQDYCEMIQDNANRMNKMITQVLDVNAIEANKLNMNLQRCDVAEVVGSVADSFKVIGAQKNIQINRDLPCNKYFAHIDRTYAMQIFDNILSNAIKYSPSGKKVRLAVDATESLVDIQVIDEGPGMSPEDRQLLFQRFSKLSSKPTGGELSTGLGLSIAKKYAHAMSGNIHVESTLGLGTTFHITFPVV